MLETKTIGYGAYNIDEYIGYITCVSRKGNSYIISNKFVGQF